MSQGPFLIFRIDDRLTYVMTDINWINFHLEKYYITQNRFKLFTSYDKDDTPMVTSLTEDICRHATEEIFLPVRHGTYQLKVRAMNDGRVGGKL